MDVLNVDYTWWSCWMFTIPGGHVECSLYLMVVSSVHHTWWSCWLHHTWWSWQLFTIPGRVECPVYLMVMSNVHHTWWSCCMFTITGRVECSLYLMVMSNVHYTWRSCRMFTIPNGHVKCSLYLMVMSKDALSNWLLSLAKLTQVTPFVCAFSNFRRHWPVVIFHTWEEARKTTSKNKGDHQQDKGDTQQIISIIIIIYSLNVRVIGAPQMISQPFSSIFPCSPLPSGTWQTPGLSIPWCCLPISSSVCLVFFPLSLYLARWFWPDLMNRRHVHTTAVCISFTMVRRCGLIACWILTQTSSLVTWSLYEMRSILQQPHFHGLYSSLEHT